jgi:hypothetical protein
VEKRKPFVIHSCLAWATFLALLGDVADARAAVIVTGTRAVVRGSAEDVTVFCDLLNEYSRFTDPSTEWRINHLVQEFWSIDKAVGGVGGQSVFGQSVFAAIGIPGDDVGGPVLYYDIGRSQPGVFIGAAKKTIDLQDVVGFPLVVFVQRIDLDDVLAFPVADPILNTRASWLLHEVFERSRFEDALAEGLSIDAAFRQAHARAIDAQNGVLADDGGSGARVQAGDTFVRLSPTEMEIRIPFRDRNSGLIYHEIITVTSSDGTSFDIADIQSGVIDTGVPWSGREIGIEIVSVRSDLAANVAAVPEPGAFAIWALGMVGVGWGAARRRSLAATSRPV